jgi:hypothetical protein
MSLRESQGFSPPPCRTPGPWHRPPTQPNLHSTVTTNPRNNALFHHRMNRNSREVGRLSHRSHHSCCPLVCRSNKKKTQFGSTAVPHAVFRHAINHKRFQTLGQQVQDHAKDSTISLWANNGGSALGSSSVERGEGGGQPCNCLPALHCPSTPSY